MGRLNDVSKIVGARLCPVQPVQSAMGGRWSYPWEHMQPGDVIEITDPSPRARSAMAAAAAQWTRRHGALFATGQVWDTDARPMVQTGWWCARVDGVEIEPPDPTFKQQEAAEATRDAFQAELTRHGHGAISTQLAPFETVGPFYLAEDYHQQYLHKNPRGYCGLGGTGVSCPIGTGA